MSRTSKLVSLSLATALMGCSPSPQPSAAPAPGNTAQTAIGQAAANAIAQARTKLAGKTVSYDYWLDASERPAVVVADLSSFQGAMADGELPKDAMGPAKMTVRYSEWNVPVRVVAPPAAQTMSFDEAMKSMGDAGMFGPGGTDEETASSSASSPA